MQARPGQPGEAQHIAAELADDLAQIQLDAGLEEGTVIIRQRRAQRLDFFTPALER